jgi:hypothetical protein
MKSINNIGGYGSYVYSRMKILDLVFVIKMFELQILKFELLNLQKIKILNLKSSKIEKLKF